MTTATDEARALAAHKAKARGAALAKTGIPARFLAAPAFDPEGAVAALFGRREERRAAAEALAEAELERQMVDGRIEALRANVAQGACVRGREEMAAELDALVASRQADLEAAGERVERARRAASEARGTGLVVFGPTGSGKTFRASTVARAAFVAGMSVLFVDAVSLADRARDAVAKGSAEARGELVARASSVDLLVIDDLGKKSATPWFVSNVLFRIANARYNDGLDTVVTTQCLTPKMLSDTLSKGGCDPQTCAAVVRRLTEGALALDTRGGQLFQYPMSERAVG